MGPQLVKMAVCHRTSYACRILIGLRPTPGVQDVRWLDPCFTNSFVDAAMVVATPAAQSPDLIWPHRIANHPAEMPTYSPPFPNGRLCILQQTTGRLDSRQDNSITAPLVDSMAASMCVKSDLWNL